MEVSSYRTTVPLSESQTAACRIEEPLESHKLVRYLYLFCTETRCALSMNPLCQFPVFFYLHDHIRDPCTWRGKKAAGLHGYGVASNASGFGAVSENTSVRERLS
eukprot:1192562-Prorocentrum_minimum.AAC.7